MIRDLELLDKLKDYISKKQGTNQGSQIKLGDYKDDLKNYMFVKFKTDSFITTLRNLEEKSHLKPSQIYNRAWLSKEVYYGFFHRSDYVPKRETLLALAIGLHLYVDDTKHLFNSCGYVFPSTSEDYVVQFFMEKDLYARGNDIADYDDLATVNGLLDEMHCKILGTKCRS